MAASSSISCNSDPTPTWRYHVFLSFRGKDTRNNFTDHLYAALCRRAIITFRDDEELERGEVIGRQLPKAIEESLSSIIILSQNYASSSWCLDELQKILKCRKTLDRWILPVFYGVDPSDVRHQRGSFAEAFRRHEERFGESSEKVQSWREALSEVAGLSGFHSHDRRESEFIDEVIAALWTKLQPNLPRFIDNGFVGMDAKIKNICQNLEIGSSDVRFVGIWGMGGIGKTTLARTVSNEFRNHFDISCCLENVREQSSAVDGLLGLQMKLLSKLKNGNLEIDNLDYGKATLRNLLSHRKVLLFLDDIDDVRQLEYLAEKQDWFGKGSRIVVTTRDIHTLESHHASVSKYLIEVELLNTDESLELFCRKAFAGNRPREGYEELSKKLAYYCQGLPLALKVLGSYFCGRDLSVCKDSFEKIKKDPPKDIFGTLRISYEGLENAEKTVFLDIACHFVGWHGNRVEEILKHCDFSHKMGIQILIERSLLIWDGYGEFKMHDLLQEMGKKMVIEESNNDISKQSRLWSPKDINEVLKKNMGTEFIQSIVLTGYNMYGRCDPEAFSKMHNLRVLIIPEGLPLPFGLRCLPSSLKVIEWYAFPLKFLPTRSELNKLVELKMHHSKIKQLWNGIQNFENLKFIDMSYSKALIQTPNFFGAPNLESLVFEGCSNLVKVHESAGQLEKFVIINFKDCINIKYLPNFFGAPNLEGLVLGGCSKLVRVPESIGQLKKLVILDLEYCINIKHLPRRLETNSLKGFNLYGCSKLKKLPEFVENREGISMLDLRGCKNLECLPNSIWNLKHLTDLNTSGCSKLYRLPETMNANKTVKRLDLSGTAIKEVPPFITRFQNLTSLSLRGCGRPVSNPWWEFFGNSGSIGLKLPPPLFSCPMLREFDASYCKIRDGSIPDDLSGLSSLEALNLSGNNFVTLPPSCISKLRCLRKLRLNDCPKLQSLPTFPLSLRIASAINCSLLKHLPVTEIWKLLMPNEVYPKHEPFSAIPGNKIPLLFDRQKDVPLCDYKSSITVDIPYCCRSSEWWGIAVCLLVESVTSANSRKKGSLAKWEVWYGISVEAELLPYYTAHPLKVSYRKDLSRRHLFILFLDGSGGNGFQKFLRDDQDKVKLHFWVNNAKVKDWHSKPLKIRRCGWRVICKNEVRQEASIVDLENFPSEHSSGFNES